MGFNLKSITCKKCGLVVVGEGKIIHECFNKKNNFNKKMEKKILSDILKKSISEGFENAIKEFKTPTHIEIKNSIYQKVMEEIFEKYELISNEDFIRLKYPANIENSDEFNIANKSSLMEEKNIPKIDRRVGGC